MGTVVLMPFLSFAASIQCHLRIFVSALFKWRARSYGSGAYNNHGKWATKARCMRNLVIFRYETPPKNPLCKQKNPLCMNRTPPLWEFLGIPKKGPFSRREFHREFQRFPTSGIPALRIPSTSRRCRGPSSISSESIGASKHPSHLRSVYLYIFGSSLQRESLPRRYAYQV